MAAYLSLRLPAGVPRKSICEFVEYVRAAFEGGERRTDYVRSKDANHLPNESITDLEIFIWRPSNSGIIISLHALAPANRSHVALVVDVDSLSSHFEVPGFGGIGVGDSDLV